MGGWTTFNSDHSSSVTGTGLVLHHHWLTPLYKRQVWPPEHLCIELGNGKRVIIYVHFLSPVHAMLVLQPISYVCCGFH